MARLDAWKAGASTLTINCGNPNLPKFNIGTAGIDAGTLSALSSEELAQGWPQAMVDRAHNRRGSKKRVWIGPNGLTLGTTPHSDICGDDSLVWLERVANPKSPVGRYPLLCYTYGYVDRDTSKDIVSYDSPLVAQAMHGSLGAVQDLVNWATGDIGLVVKSYTQVVLGGGNAGYGFHYVTVSTHLANIVPLLSETDFVVAVQYGGTKMTYAICERPLWARGIDSLIYSHSNIGGGGEPGNATHTEFGVNLFFGGGHMTQGWFNLLQMVNPAIVQRDPFSGMQYSETHLEANCWAPAISWSAPTPLSPLGTDLAAGPHLLNLTSREVFHIGDPEFADSLDLKGPLTYDAAARSITVADDRIWVRWLGQTLVDAGTVTTPGDIEQLHDKVFTTLIDNTPFTGTLSLTDLSLYQVCADAGEDLGSQEFMEARDGKPAITFNEALNRANAGDKRVYHMVAGFTDVGWQIANKVVLSGDGQAGTLTATAWYGSAALAATIDDCMAFIAAGAMIIDKTTNVAGDVCNAVFGMTEDAIRAAKSRWNGRSDFNDLEVFHRRLPDPTPLPAARRTALYMTQFVLDRRSLTSFALGGVMMANRARKYLL